MARFKKGQEVVCINSGWIYQDDRTKAPGPRMNDIVTVRKYDGPRFIYFYEYEGSYLESCFAPVSDITELTEILESQPVEV